MKTVFHATIDGHEIVLGFGEPHIAPVETYAIVEPLLADLPEYVAAQAQALKVAEARQSAAMVLGQAQTALACGHRTESDHLNSEYRARGKEIDLLEAALTSFVEAFEAAKRALVEAHAVYFHPREGEDIITEAQHSTFAETWADRGKSALGEHAALKLDGTLIADYRGRRYWRRAAGVWERQDITALGFEPIAGAIAEDELTPEQRQEIGEQAGAERIAALSPEARDAERAEALQAAVARAAAMRSELEIAGDKDALAKSQAAYAEEARRIAAKYGG